PGRFGRCVPQGDELVPCCLDIELLGVAFGRGRRLPRWQDNAGWKRRGLGGVLDEVLPHCRRQVYDCPSCISVVGPVLLEVEHLVHTPIVPNRRIPGWVGRERLT